MSECPLYPACGGCINLELDDETYRRRKYEHFQHVIGRIRQADIQFGSPVFIPSGTRRRAAMAFRNVKKKFCLGFNATQSKEIIDCRHCPRLTEGLNRNLENIRGLLQDLCAEPYTVKQGKKVLRQGVSGGDVLMCEAADGIDVTLELPFAPELAHRMIISEYAARCSDIIRISWRRRPGDTPETIVEKLRPVINNSGIDVCIPAGTFLQASQAGEQALINLVMSYIGDRSGRIADLFCGIGTFSYPLSKNKNNRILAVDSSAELLEGFRRTVNLAQISNIKVQSANLFKYPLDAAALAEIDIVVFDPPRAGAAAQVAAIAAAPVQPPVVVAVSCNPHTFVNDADRLISGGYTLKEITMVDQFVYSGHTELVALFEKEK